MSNSTSGKSTEKYWKNLSWVLFSVIFRMIVGIGSSIIFIRYLGDKGYGAVIVMADFITLFIVLLSMGLGVVQTRVLPQLFVQKEYGKAKDVILKTFIVRIGLASIIPILLYFCSPYLLKYIYVGIPDKLLWVALCIIPVQMCISCLRGTLEVTFNQKYVSFWDVSGLVVRLLAVVPVILLDMGIVWFFVTQLLSDIYLLFVYWRGFYRKIWFGLRHVKRQKYIDNFYWTGIIMMMILFCNRFLGKEMDTQILLFRLRETGLSEVAIYSISFMLAIRSLSFIGVGSGSVANLSQAMMSEFVGNGNTKAIEETYSGQLQLFYLLVIPLIAGSFVFSGDILVFMYGANFSGSGIVCSILFLALGGTIINYMNYPILYAYGLEKKILKCRAFFGLMNLILSFILSFKGALGVASATGVCLVGISVTETLFVRQLISLKGTLFFFVKTIMGSLIMAVFAWGVFKLLPAAHVGLNLVFSIIIGIFIYLNIMIFLKPLDSKVIDSISLPKMVQSVLGKLAI